MKFKLSMLLAILLITFGSSTSSGADWELHLDGLVFDWTTKSQFVSQTQLVVVSQFRTFDQLYQAKVDLINIHDKAIMETVILGDKTQDNYSPQLVVMNENIYVAYINQVGSIINVKLMKFDINLVAQETWTIGESLEQAKFDETFSYIQLDLIKKDTIGISWYSRGQLYNQRQWNFRILNQEKIITLPDSKYISIAQNSYGVTTFVQRFNNKIYLSKLDSELTTTTLIEDLNWNDKPEVFSLPNNQFIVCYSGRLRYFNHNFEPIGVSIDSIFGLPATATLDNVVSKHIIDYNLYVVSTNNLMIVVNQIDIRQQSQPLQTRTLQFPSYFRSINIQSDIIDHNLYVRWLYQGNYNFKDYNLSLFYFDMSFYLDECISNCMMCNPKYKCQECEVGYSNIDNKCIPICPDNCEFCSNPNYCDKCKEGFQYTPDNQCVTPIIKQSELQISDEPSSKGQPRMLIIDNQMIIIYGVLGQSHHLKIKVLNSLGKVKLENYLKYETLIDYDITQGNDVTQFYVLVKCQKDGVEQIILYTLSIVDLSVISEQQTQLPETNVDKIRIEKLQSYGLGIIYTTSVYYVPDLVNLNYLMIDNQGIQRSYPQFYQVYVSQFDFETNCQQDTVLLQFNTHIGYRILKMQFGMIEFGDSNANAWDPQSQSLYVISDLNLYLYTDQSDYQTKELYLSTSDQKYNIKVTQTTRNPSNPSAQIMGNTNVFVIWLGQTNIQDSQQIEQVYLQKVSLQTYSISQFIPQCSENCINCDELNCLQCKNDFYQLTDGKCQLICPQNCEKCEKENECQACSGQYYLDHQLQCKDEQPYLNKQEGYLGIFVSYSEDQNLQQVSLKLSNTNYDIVYEEFDRKGNSLSGEIIIPISQGYFVIPKQPKVYKKGQIIVISFFTQTQQSSQINMMSNLVILDGGYSLIDQQYYQPNQDYEIEYFLSNDQQLYRFVASLNPDLTLQSLSINSVRIANSQYFNQQQSYIQYSGNAKIKNLRFENQSSNLITILYTAITQSEEIDYVLIYDKSISLLKDPLPHSNIRFYDQQYVIQDVINRNLAKVQFYNANQILNEQQIESPNTLSQFNLQINQDYVYVIYVEKIITIQLMQISLIQYTIDGVFNKKVTLNTNELEVVDLNVAVNDEFIQLAWASAKSKTVYKTLMTKELSTIAIDAEICMQNCELCNGQQCIKCYPGYEYDEICKPICSDNCQSCSKPHTCDYCIEHYVYVDQQCVSIYSLKLENTICSDTCYGPAQMITLDKTIISYLNYDQQVYSVEIVGYMTDSQQQQLLIQTTQIYYHQIFKYTQDQFALLWLSGDCQIQCRLMIQLFNNDLTIVMNPYELRVLTVDLKQFNLQINNFNQDIIFVWTELENSLPQTYIGQYNIQTGFTIQQNVNQNPTDKSTMPILITQSGFYQVVYLMNDKIINVLTIQGTIVSYQQIYNTQNLIQSMYAIQLPQNGILVGWIEIIDLLSPQNQLCLRLFDANFNAQKPINIVPTRFKQVSNLQLLYTNWQYVSIFYVEQEDFDTQRIRISLISMNSLVYEPQISTDFQSVLNYISQYEPGSIFTSYQINPQQGGILYTGTRNNKRQIFIQQEEYLSYYYHQCPNRCFYCDQDNICQICEEGSQLNEEQNLCVKGLPDYCEIGYDGQCNQCSDGYQLDGNVCILYDPQYNEVKINTYSLQSKQRTSTFSNGDYIAVWFRRYYENQGTGVFMSLFNSHGENLIKETRISISSAGIQVFPDVQVLNDEFVVVWIDGDLDISANIKMQRFSKQFIRIGEEITVKQDIKLNAKQYDTPIMIQRIITGYLVVWTQNREQQDKLYVNFYDQQGNYVSEFDLSQGYQIKNTEPVVASNSQLIVILWGSQQQEIIASIFSLNNILINTQILSKNGQAPSIAVLDNGNFVTAWKEQVEKSQKIIHRQYLSDMSQQIYSFTLGENEYNQNNPDIININQGYAIIFENTYYLNSDIRNLKLQIFNLEGQIKTNIITVTNQKNVYPHHPQLNVLPQGEFIASWTSSPITQNSLTDDVYMKRYNSEGDQLLLSTLVCVNNCQTCVVNDICQVCMDGYILVQQRCYKAIKNCNSYQQDALVCTQCNSEYQLIQNKCLKLGNQLSIEFITDITTCFKQIVLANGNIAAFWSDYNSIWGQQFDQYGKQITLSKVIVYSNGPQVKYPVFFDVVSGNDNTYVLAYSNIGNLEVRYFDQFDNMMWQTQTFQNIQLFDEIKPSLRKLIVQLKYIDTNTIALFNLFQQSPDQMQLRMSILNKYQPIDNNRILLTFSASTYNDDIDIQSLNGQIQVLLPRGGYQLLTYDNQGFLVSKQNIQKNRSIQSSIKQINSTTYIESWIELQLTTYEVYYQFKQFDGKNITDQISLSTSEELYKFDVNIALLNEIIAVTWREGSDAENMNANTFYKAALISPKTGAVSQITLNALAQTLQASQLPNLDIIFSFIVYNEQVNEYALTAVKVNQKGQQLDFTTIRCSYGCQECTDVGQCVKCYSGGQLQDGNCIVKQTNCKNYAPDCQNCLFGYYKTKDKTCELITQFVETQIDTGLPAGALFKTAYFPDGTSIVVSQELNFLRSGPLIIYSIMNDADRVQDFALLIDEENNIHLFVVLSWSNFMQFNQFIHQKYDGNFNKIGDQNVILQNYNWYDYRSLRVKILQTQIGIAIESISQVYFAVYSADFTSLIGNNVYSQSIINDFDFTSNSDNIVFVYAFNTEGIVKMYDKQLNFIRDIYLSDGSVIRTTINSLNQIIVVTSKQINIIEQGKLIQSATSNIYPKAIEVNSLNQIIVLSYTNLIENSLLLKFFDKTGQYQYEQQVNMLASPQAPFRMFKLSNQDLIIQFQEQMTLFASRYDQYGKSRSINDVTCPTNCDTCIASTFCQICSNKYKRNEVTLQCEKVCTVSNCKSCEKYECDVCQDGYSMSTTGECILITYQPLPNQQQVVDQCSQPFDVRTLRFNNGDFALVYSCLNTIQIRRFNIQSEELQEYSTQFTWTIYSYDVQLVQDVVYFAFSFGGSMNQATIYKLKTDFSELLFVKTINNYQSILQIYFGSIGSQYTIVLQDYKFYQLEGISLYCKEYSYFIFDQNDQQIMENRDFLSPQTIMDCNRNVFIKVQNQIQMVINEQTVVRLQKLDYNGLMIQQPLLLEPFSQIYFDISDQIMVFVQKIIGLDSWQLTIWDRDVQIYREDNFLFGDYQFSIETTETQIVISWNSGNIIEYKVLNLQGGLINRKTLINKGQTTKPILQYIQPNIVGLVWNEMNNQYGLSFAMIDQNGEFAQTTMLCSDNCLACSSSSMCTSCQDGFDLMNNQCWKRCSSLCLGCNSGMCVNCSFGFYPSQETCLLDEVQQTAIQVNEFSQFTQTQADAASFQDGSIIVVWASMGEDGESWGVYGQLQDNQGKKVGDNIRISQSTQGAQHSPKVVRLFDDSVLVVYIDGDPNTSAFIKGTRFTNQMVKIGNEQLFATFTFSQYRMHWQSILDVESLKNGGFVIVWGQDNGTIQKQLNLQFYDLAGNLVIQNTISLQDSYIDTIRISSTLSSFAIIYNNYSKESRSSVNLYTLDGQFISTIGLIELGFAYSYLQFISVDQYYGVVVQDYSINSLRFQLYNNQFEKSGNSIYINIQEGFVEYLAIYKSSLGFYLTAFQYKNFGQRQQSLYFIDLNWQVTLISQLHLSVGWGQLLKITLVESINNQYFLVWESQSYNFLDSSNIYLQRFSQTGTLLRIDEIACSPNCEQCEAINTCTVCINGYTNMDNQCTPICEQRCSYCTAPFQCDICENGYYQPIEGKCSPLPITYYEPEVLITYDINSNAIGVDQISLDTLALYTQKTIYQEGYEIFELNLIQNKQVIKAIKAQVNTLTTNYYTVYPYYIDDNLILVFYYSDRIVIKRFDSQANVLLDQQVQWPANIGTYFQYSTLLEPLQNNQYSLIFCNQNYAIEFKVDNQLIVSQTIFDGQLNIIRGPDQILVAFSGNIQNKQKHSFTIMYYDTQQWQVVITSNGIIKNQQIYSSKISSSSYQIYKIANGNYVQIVSSYYDINSFNYYFSGSYVLYYRILDSNYVPLTTEEKVIDNNYLRQNFMNIYVFDDSFTILVEQVNYYKQEISQIITQRFDNSGQKIGSFQLINSLKSYAFKKDIPYDNGYLILWEFKDYSTQYTQVLSKQFNQQGMDIYDNNAKCIPYCDQCINSYYCQSCSANYSLDAGYQCQLVCPVNCEICSSPNSCSKCTLGYQVVDDQCKKINCISNCAQCSLEGVCNLCEENYQFAADLTCQPICASNCSSCSSPLLCDTCSSGYVITTDQKCQAEFTSILTQIQNTTVGTPIIATFPNGDYIMLWYQSGDNAGVYFQLYTKDNVKVGDPTKVGGLVRRLLTQTIEQQFAADVAVNENSFAVLWLDASSESTMAKLQKFDSSGVASSDIVELGAYPQTDLQNIKLPCQIATTSNNNFLVSYIAQSDSSYSLFVETFDSQLGKKGAVKEIKKVNVLSAPTITADDNGVISLTYQSEGYLFVQQLTEDGEAIDSPKSISDTNSMIVRTTNLEDGFLVFLWENRNLLLSTPQFLLNFQLISKDLKTRSEISIVGTIQNGQLQPDIQSFNEGFIIVWKLTDSSYKSSGLQFQMFDSLGSPTKDPVDVDIEGLYPENPRIQIINEEQFAITWTAKNVDVDGTILGDGIFMEKYNQYGILVPDSWTTDLCSYKCESCQSPLVCLKCQYGFYLNDNSQCIVDCGSFCDSCSTPWTCQTCKNGYSLHSNGGCIETECTQGYIRNQTTKLCDPECPQECTKCTEPQKCSGCQEGYILSNGECNQLQGSDIDQQSTIYALIIILLAAGFISMSACAIAQYCQKKKLLKLTQPSYCQVHPQQDITINNRSLSASCNISVIRQPHE